MADNTEINIKINKIYNRIIKNKLRDIIKSKKNNEENENIMKNSYLYNNKIIKEIAIDNYLLKLDSWEESLNSYSSILSNKKIIFKTKKENLTESNFLVKIKTRLKIKDIDCEKIDNLSLNKIIDSNKICINRENLLNILSYTNFYRNFLNLQLESSIINTNNIEKSNSGILKKRKIIIII
jgi:hypothetical protein